MIRHAAVLARELENGDMVVHIKGDASGYEVKNPIAAFS